MECSRPHLKSSWRGAFCVLLLPLASALSRAQEIIPPPTYVPPELLNRDPGPCMRLGKADFYPRVSVLGLYDDNILASASFKKSDFLWSISPGATVTLGEPSAFEKTLAFDYSPTFVAFTDHTEFTTVNHAARLSGTCPFAKLALGFSQSFALQSSAAPGLSGRVEHQSYSTRFTSRYEIGEKMSLELNTRQALTDYRQRVFIDSREWAGDSWLNWQVLPKLNAGAGLSIGRLEVERNPGQIYRRLSVRGACRLTEKLDLNASVGVEQRHYDGTGSAHASPVFNLGARYQPAPDTVITVNGSRSEQNSACIAGANYVSTGYSATVQQGLRERFVIAIASGYRSSDYHLTRTRISGTRSDTVFFVRPSVDWIIRRNVSAGVFYSFRRNASNEKYYDYDTNQAGVQASWAF